MEPKTMQEAYRTPLNQAESRMSYVENHQDFVERKSYKTSQPLAQSVLALRTVRMPMPMVKDDDRTHGADDVGQAHQAQQDGQDAQESHKHAAHVAGQGKVFRGLLPVPAIMIDTTLNKNKIVTHSKNVPMYLPQ